MEDMSCDPGDKKRKNGIASCPNPGSPKTSTFKLKKKTNTPPKPVVGQASLHMNMRNLGDDSGTIRPVAVNGKESLTSGQMKQAAADETATTKSRKILFKFKKKA